MPPSFRGKATLICLDPVYPGFQFCCWYAIKTVLFNLMVSPKFWKGFFDDSFLQRGLAGLLSFNHIDIKISDIYTPAS